MKIGATTLWPEYQLQLSKQGVASGPDSVIAAGFCARGDMTVADALQNP
jgi:hypothetical protein